MHAAPWASRYSSFDPLVRRGRLSLNVYVYVFVCCVCMEFLVCSLFFKYRFLFIFLLKEEEEKERKKEKMACYFFSFPLTSCRPTVDRCTQVALYSRERIHSNGRALFSLIWHGFFCMTENTLSARLIFFSITFPSLSIWLFLVHLIPRHNEDAVCDSNCLHQVERPGAGALSMRAPTV